MFRPKLLTLLKSYAWPDFTADLTAGAIVGVVALPLAIAFAIASGVTPDRGLVTAIVAGFLISALGGSRTQIGGPTGAFVVIVAKIVQDHGVDGLVAATLLAGAMLIAMGMLKLGAAVKFIPYPLIVGFTSGIAVVIFTSQVKDFLGLAAGPLPAEFLEKWAVYASSLGTASAPTLGLALFSLAVILFWPKIDRRVPGPIVALIAATALAHGLGLPVETIGSRFGDLPAGLPGPSWPALNLSRLRELAGPAATIALLGAIESLLSATVADGMIGSRHRSNTELIAQGIANIASALFGGIPATGAIARTATNVKNGGRTPVAGIIHALILLLIVLLFGHWAKLIPLCVLAAILVVVAYHMSEWHAFKALLKAPRSDVAVLLVTFLLTVLVDLTVAVEVGFLLAVVLFARNMTAVSAVRPLGSDGRPEDEEPAPLDAPEGVAVFQARGALFFGAVESIRDMMGLGADPPKVLVLGMTDVLAVDATAIRALADMHAVCNRHKTRLILAGVHSQPREALERSGFIASIGGENVRRDGLRAVVAGLTRTMS